MTELEFYVSRLEHFERMLNKPEYTMFNGKKSHVVAIEEISKAQDWLIENNKVGFNAYGRMVFCDFDDE